MNVSRGPSKKTRCTNEQRKPINIARKNDLDNLFEQLDDQIYAKRKGNEANYESSLDRLEDNIEAARAHRRG